MLDAVKYLVGASDLFKHEGIEVQNSLLDDISLQCSGHEDWTEFVQNHVTSLSANLHAEADELLKKDKTQDLLDSISTVDIDNAGSIEDDSDGWCEVHEHPSGSTDTLLQEPGEGNKPLGIFMDKDSEYLSFPTIFCGKRRPENNQRKVLVSYGTVCKWELRCQDRRAAMSAPNIFFKLKKMQIKQIQDSACISLRNVKQRGKSILLVT